MIFTYKMQPDPLWSTFPKFTALGSFDEMTQVSLGSVCGLASCREATVI